VLALLVVVINVPQIVAFLPLIRGLVAVGWMAVNVVAGERASR